MSEFEYQLTVTRPDIDSLGHANNVSYMKWMQEAAIAHSRARGWPPERYEALGAGWVVRHHDVDYYRSARLGDVLKVKTWLSERKRSTILRHYEIKKASEGVLVRATTQWVFVNYRKQRPVRIPEQILIDFHYHERGNRE